MDGTLSLVLIEAVLILLAISICKAIRLISPLDDSCKDVDPIPTVSSPSHIVAAPPATKYNVFLSFRGEDTRDSFSSHLYEALRNAEIHTFMDHKLHKGQHIAPVLLKTIEESEISLIIFSKDYASSTWCMNELVHIMKCRDKYGRIVIPIFYHVDPSNIHKLNGSFGDGFAKLKFRFKHNQEKLQEWKNALIKSSKLSGWDSKNIRQQLISNPEKPIRLCRPEDIDHVFHNDKGIETVRCLLLDLSKIRRTTWRASNFGKMHNLIFLKVHKSDKRRKTSKLAIGEDLDYLSEELRFFIWEEYPFPHVPLHFCSENLITLEMRNSNIRQLWNENQKFPNLKEIILSNSKDLTALPNLSHAPKIKYVGVDGCVNLDQIHSSTALRNFYSLWVGDDGPKRINIGGSMKGTRLGLVMVFNCLDLDKSSFHKVRMKMMICGDVICGVGLRHVEMPMAENEKVKLRYLLPFVRRVKLLEGPIEYGHEFRQHYDYDNDHRHSHYFADDVVITMEVRRRGDRGGERHVEGPLTRQMINDQQTLKEAGEEEKEDEELMIDQREMINDDQVVATTTLMEVEEEELIMEYYCSSSNSNATIFTRVPTCITRWSLLTELTLRKSDMVEDSLILNSLSSLCHAGYCKPLFHQTLSLHIPPSAFTESDDYEFIFERNSGWLYCKLRSYMPLHPDYDFVVEFVHC